MDIRPIRNDGDHRAALREVERLWGAAEGTPEGDKLDVLATLIEAYENRYYPVPDADPVDILHFAIDDMGRSQAELSALLGSRARASEVLSRKRRLTVEMIAKSAKPGASRLKHWQSRILSRRMRLRKRDIALR